MGKAHSILLLTVLLLEAFSPAAAEGHKRTVAAWAWKRSEDLSWIASENIEVAVLLGTVIGRGGEIELDLRREPLLAPKSAVTTAVFRIEGFPERARVESARTRTIESIVRMSGELGLKRIQIDFDARVSQRVWYRDFLTELKSKLTHGTTLEMTALVSWCREEKDWLTALPVDSVVPMFFRMGDEGQEMKRLLAESERNFSPVCTKTIGISLDEPIVVPDGVRRVYLFNPKAWKKDDLLPAEIFGD